MDETLGLIIEYMDQYQPLKRWIWDSYEEEGVCGEVLEGASTRIELIITQQNMAHNYVLNNTNIMPPWVRWDKHLKPTHHMFSVVAVQNLTPLQLDWP
jgi:hypothetical protein